MIGKHRGSLFIDASICMPIFIICMVLIIRLICQAGLEEEMYHEMNLRTTLWKETSFETENDAINFMYLPSLGNLEGVKGSQCIIASSSLFLDTERKLVYRLFGGETDYGMEEGITVYIFPKYGTKYHLSGCWTMDMYPENYTSLSQKEAEEKGYSKCMICFPTD